jgi:hypothetical protein
MNALFIRKARHLIELLIGKGEEHRFKIKNNSISAILERLQVNRMGNRQLRKDTSSVSFCNGKDGL